MLGNFTGAAIGGLLAAVGAGEAAAGKQRGRGAGKSKGKGKGKERDKVDICHYDADRETWVKSSVSQHGWENGHAKHKRDYRLTGECCSDRDCEEANTSCIDGACTDDGPGQCTTCGDGCPGAAENNPTKTVTFVPIGNPDYCGVVVTLTGFAGCTEYAAEYWSALNEFGLRAQNRGPVTLGPTDLTGSSQTDMGTYVKGGAVDIRLAGAAANFQSVDC
jgi:hypothetical protein